MDSSYSLEATLLQSTRYCQVWIYDPTKGEKARGYIPRLLRHRAHFGKLALGASDRHGPTDDPKAWSLKSLMAENGASLFSFTFFTAPLLPLRVRAGDYRRRFTRLRARSQHRSLRTSPSLDKRAR